MHVSKQLEGRLYLNMREREKEPDIAWVQCVVELQIDSNVIFSFFIVNYLFSFHLNITPSSSQSPHIPQLLTPSLKGGERLKALKGIGTPEEEQQSQQPEYLRAFRD